jgi:hypothetical protein
MMSVFGPQVQQPVHQLDASFMNQGAPTNPPPVPLQEMDPSALLRHPHYSWLP